MIRVRKTILILAAVLFLAVAGAGSAYAGAMLANLENALMCKCDDKCGKVLINCTCDTAEQTRVEFSKMLDSGLTVDQIIQMQVGKYGETVLAAPTKSGFKLTAWLTPFAAILVGGLGIRKIIEVWTRKTHANREEKKSSQEEASDTLPNKYSSRLQDELDQIEL